MLMDLYRLLKEINQTSSHKCIYLPEWKYHWCHISNSHTVNPLCLLKPTQMLAIRTSLMHSIKIQKNRKISQCDPIRRWISSTNASRSSRSSTTRFTDYSRPSNDIGQNRHQISSNCRSRARVKISILTECIRTSCRFLQ